MPLLATETTVPVFTSTRGTPFSTQDAAEFDSMEALLEACRTQEEKRDLTALLDALNQDSAARAWFLTQLGVEPRHLRVPSSSYREGKVLEALLNLARSYGSDPYKDPLIQLTYVVERMRLGATPIMALVEELARVLVFYPTEKPYLPSSRLVEAALAYMEKTVEKGSHLTSRAWSVHWYLQNPAHWQPTLELSARPAAPSPEDLTEQCRMLLRQLNDESQHDYFQDSEEVQTVYARAFRAGQQAQQAQWIPQAEVQNGGEYQALVFDKETPQSWQHVTAKHNGAYWVRVDSNTAVDVRFVLWEPELPPTPPLPTT